MKYSISEFDTIIFDLGEVIVNLDTQAVVNEFARLLKLPSVDLKSILVGSDELYLYETGQIDKGLFIERIVDLLGAQISVQDFENAWNLMLADIPIERLQFMKELMNTHEVLILSNTNGMHEERFDEMVKIQTGKIMKDFAHKAYYSHRIGYRKPNQDIYEFVINDRGLIPSKSLFLDDKIENVLAARDVGLRSEQVLKSNDIFQILGNA
ncbi:MAG: HAD-IA family hydrolase [Cyclobacteriaceae bacterium]